MLKLHPIKHDLKTTLWCGPAVLSICCGVPTSKVHEVIKSFRPEAGPVKGIYNRELVRAAESLGFRLEKIWDRWVDDPGGFKVLRKQPTLAAFTKTFAAYMKDAPVIINVTGHYVVVQGRKFVDNQVDKPVALKKAPGRRRRVIRAWRVVPVQSAKQ